MTSKGHHPTWTGKQAGLIGIAILLLAGFCFGQAAVSLSPKDGPPTTTLHVSGSGFTPYAQIDIYFDSQDQALAVADASGAFTQIAIQAPKSAVPGNHWITAAERSGRLVKQEIFEVHVNWDQFLTRDMRRENPYENVLNVDNVGSLEVKGSYPTGRMESSPAVVNGVVYFGADNHNLYAMNTNNGALLWSYPMASNVFSSPAVANGVVYSGSRDGNLYAIDAKTGALRWNYPTGDAVDSSPAVVNGVVYVGSNDHNVYALNATTGEKLWSYMTAGYMDHSSPAVIGGALYVCAWDSHNWIAYALDAKNGALTGWRNASFGEDCSPAVAGGMVYVGGIGVYAYDTKTGALVWSYPSLVLDSGIAVGNGAVYFGTDDGFVYALDASTGALLWTFTANGYVWSTPAVANGVVYVGVAPPVRARRRHRSPVVEILDGLRYIFFAHSSEWRGVCRLGRW